MGLFYQLVESQDGQNGLLPGLGVLGDEISASGALHNAGGMDPAHCPGGPGNDSGTVGKADGTCCQRMSRCLRQTGEHGGRLFPGQGPSGSNLSLPTPLTISRAAIFSTFTSLVSEKVTRWVMGEPVTVSYRAVARA